MSPSSGQTSKLPLSIPDEEDVFGIDNWKRSIGKRSCDGLITITLVIGERYGKMAKEGLPDRRNRGPMSLFGTIQVSYSAAY